jgi:methylenetetrahydrofolate reductase (NADH)
MTPHFAQNFSLEATRPTPGDIAALASVLPKATQVYLSAVDADPHAQIKSAAGLRNAGLEPVPHIAARRLDSAEQLAALIAGLRREADARRLLIIGGDVDQSGPFADALAVIQHGGLRAAGIQEVGIGVYPEGHPRIPPRRLEAALDQKIAAVRAAGLQVFLVSQFSFAPEQVVAWLRKLRGCGITAPVKVGMAGPASVAGLLRYAKRCGVTASLRGLTRGPGRGLIGQLAGQVAGHVAGFAGPDDMLAALEAAGDLNAGPHYFSFGGAVETARYACEAAAGRIAA